MKKLGIIFAIFILFQAAILSSNNFNNFLKVKSANAYTQNLSFPYTGIPQSPQALLVPNDIYGIDVVLNGAGGANGGGAGGRVSARLQVTPGETLYIFVGGANGYNGGGTGVGGANGGGASDIRSGGQALSNRIAVAAGGGGGTGGGAGGGLNGVAGSGGGGAGGTQTYAWYSTLGQGGSGGGTFNNGGGGGGYYGGGAGNYDEGQTCSTNDDGSEDCSPYTNGSRAAGGGSSFAIAGSSNVIHTAGGGASSGNNGSITITLDSTINPIISSNTAVFCIVPASLGGGDIWFQTDKGDVRFNKVVNPVPNTQEASTDDDAPGIFFSTSDTNEISPGPASAKGWKVDDEEEYNNGATNKNGTMSYSFYKSKAKQDGVTPVTLNSGSPGLQAQINSGAQGNAGAVFESTSGLTINSDLNINGNRRVVILVDGGDVIIEKPIVVTNGLLIIAAKGNIVVDRSVVAIDGIYSAEGSIILDGVKNDCSAGPDLRLNVGGALIANSRKPFAIGESGIVDIQRNLCAGNATIPALVVTSRPDFLTKLTDFYKTSYSKWTEEKP